MRLDKFVLRSSSLDKSAVKDVIETGLVTVNGMVVRDCRFQVHENNQIKMQQELLTPRPFRYLMFHKPINTICSNVDGDYPSILNQIDIKNKDELHIAGRLDADTTGLVFITDDGRWSFNIMRPELSCEKTYRVNLSKPIDEYLIDQFQQGLMLPGETKITKPAKLALCTDNQNVTELNPQLKNQVWLTITEGRYHQVKRMFFSVGNRVNQLHRQQIGTVALDIPEGQWRFLTQQEVKLLSF